MQKEFINKNSVVTEIWRSTDITLFIFAGASAEFALNKQADWLYFTSKLPADPIGRLFSTVKYAQHILFENEINAHNTIDKINQIHHNVEHSRKAKIPAAAYRDVLYMLIYYSIASFELLERKMTRKEKEETVADFIKMGKRMNIPDLPSGYDSWQLDYSKHLDADLEYREYTKDLFIQYKKHLGWFRYFLLLEIQRLLVSKKVNHLLNLGGPKIAALLIPFYRLLRKLKMHNFLINIMVPSTYKTQINNMNMYTTKQ